MRQKPERPRLIVGISGASGVIYGARLLALLRELPVETHLVVSRSAEVALALETELKPADLRARADAVHAVARHGGADLVGLVPDAGHDRRAVLDPQHERDRHRGDDDPTHPRRRRRLEGAPPPGARGARDAASSRAICGR